MLVFGPKINRSYTLYLPFEKNFVEISVMFSKTNTYIGYNLDSNLYQRSKRGEVHANIFKELDKSSFATTFLDINNYKSKNLDIVSQFNNILPDFKDKINYELNETIKLSKVQTKNGIFENSLFIYVFNFLDYDTNFKFVLSERQYIDIPLNRKIVRTCGLQICTNEVYEDILTMIQYHNNPKEVKKETESVESAISSIFDNKPIVNGRKL